MHVVHEVADRWQSLGLTAEVRDTPPLIRSLGETVVVVFRSGDRYVVGLDSCPHQTGSFAGGRVVDGCLVCPFHGWSFNADGEYVQGYRGNMPEPVRASLRLQRFPVRAWQGRIWALPTPVNKIPHIDLGYVIMRWFVTINPYRIAGSLALQNLASHNEGHSDRLADAIAGATLPVHAGSGTGPWAG